MVKATFKILIICESISFRGADSWILDFVDCPTHEIKKNKKLLPSIFDRCETEA